MKKAMSLKIVLIFIIGVFIVGFVYYFHRVSEDYFKASNDILYKLNIIKRNEDKLNYEILKSSIYLYKSSDDIIETIKSQKKLVNSLLQDRDFKNKFRHTYKGLKQYAADFRQKEILTYKFLRYLAPTKNAIIFLSNAIRHVKMSEKHSRYKILNIVSKLMLLHRSNDIQILKNINVDEVKKLLDPKDPFNKAFISNLNLLLKYYPKEFKLLNEVLNFKTLHTINTVLNLYLKDTNKKVSYFQDIMIVIVLVITVLFVILLFLVYRLEGTIKKITFLAQNDQLTSLKNRIKFEMDVKQTQEASLIIFDIDKFKSINNYFGNEIGDKILVALAKELEKFKKIIPYNTQTYRIGADEFGLMVESRDVEIVSVIAEEFIRQVESKAILSELDLNITLSAGISTKTPLLEKADIALKKAQSDIKDKIILYEEKFQEQVKLNLQKAQEIKKAIEKGNLITYAQGIFDKNKNIYKYEVLCRVKIDEKNVSIFPYLDIAKEIKMYHHITFHVLKDSFEFLRNNKNINLSINLSLEDINDKEIREYIYMTLIANPDIAQRITFEILESEIESYDELSEFIFMMKQRGVSFAIDDFGSGYSNFARILKLNVDIIKIDGSIIKNIDNDVTSKSVLKTIVSFAKENNLKTVAEFIHNEDVFNVAKNMGVEYFQGFYLHEPVPLNEIEV